MDSSRFSKLDLYRLPTPCYLVDEKALEANLKKLDYVQKSSGGKILLALKAFAMYSVFPLIQNYLEGVCASSLFEARLGKEEFKKIVQTYSPAYNGSEFKEIVDCSNYVIFNSVNQWHRFREFVPKSVKCGLRVNPEYSEIEVDLYDPCARFSRLGIPFSNFPKNLEGISGIHFHALCEQNSDTLQRILAVVEEKFGPILHQLEWINLGGGHHITREDYDSELLIALIKRLRTEYNLEVFLEPGEAIALNTGVLVATVLDIIDNDMKIVILDTTAEAHMPDVLAMPYRPEIKGAEKAGQLPYNYRITGTTCLAGDVMGDYSFQKELKIGDKLIFTDMAHYTMVKNNMFNGINLPAIARVTTDNQIEVVKQFAYEAYKSRLS